MLCCHPEDTYFDNLILRFFIHVSIFVYFPCVLFTLVSKYVLILFLLLLILLIRVLFTSSFTQCTVFIAQCFSSVFVGCCLCTFMQSCYLYYCSFSISGLSYHFEMNNETKLLKTFNKLNHLQNDSLNWSLWNTTGWLQLWLKMMWMQWKTCKITSFKKHLQMFSWKYNLLNVIYRCSKRFSLISKFIRKIDEVKHRVCSVWVEILFICANATDNSDEM